MSHPTDDDTMLAGNIDHLTSDHDWQDDMRHRHRNERNIITAARNYYRGLDRPDLISGNLAHLPDGGPEDPYLAEHCRRVGVEDKDRLHSWDREMMHFRLAEAVDEVRKSVRRRTWATVVEVALVILLAVVLAALLVP